MLVCPAAARKRASASNPLQAALTRSPTAAGVSPASAMGGGGGGGSSSGALQRMLASSPALRDALSAAAPAWRAAAASWRWRWSGAAGEGLADDASSDASSCGGSSSPPAAARVAGARHAVQCAAIVAAMSRAGLTHGGGGGGGAPRVHVECGAGRGGLSEALAASPLPPRHILLVERAASTRKLDFRVRRTLASSSPGGGAGVAVQRVDLDLADLELTETGLAAACGSAQARVVVYGKHVCGAATDHALRALASLLVGDAAAQRLAGDGAAPGDDSAAEPSGGGGGGSGGAAAHSGVGLAGFGGVAIAPCCHHVCDWRSYCGKPFFRREAAAAAVAAAAASGGGGGETSPEALFDAARLAATYATTYAERGGGARAGGRSSDSDAVVAEKCRLGRACKGALDAGRAQFLDAVLRAAAAAAGGAQWRVGITQYCALALTPENRLLLAALTPPSEFEAS